MQDSYGKKQHGSYDKNKTGTRNIETKISAGDWTKNHPFDPQWIKKEADEAMVRYAEEAGRFMASEKLTNSKIRSIYGEIKRIQMSEFNNERASFILLKPKVAYALGRDEHNSGLKLFKLIFDESAAHVSDQKTFENFCNFFEAILAYHKAYGGKD